MVTNKTELSEQIYRIGAVARLTGISPDVLRVWERRYAVVEPHRSDSGTRLYTHDDIGRLALIKRLVDSGDAIGTISQLSLAALQERLRTSVEHFAAQPDHIPAEPPRVVILGDALPARLLQQEAELPGLELVAIYRDPLRFEAEAASLRPAVVVIECPTIHQQDASELWRLFRQSRARRLVIVYALGTRRSTRQLDHPSITLMRAPVDSSALRRACLADQPNALAPSQQGEASLEALLLAQPTPPRAYDNEELARLATISTRIECECPHHLADLIYSLSAFEQYSADCENRDDQDAALHRYLHQVTAHARCFLEAALKRVVEAEGLAL